MTDNEKADLKKAKKAVIQEKVFRHMLGRAPELINPDEAIENTANKTANVCNTSDAEPTVDEVTAAESERWTNLNTQPNTNDRAVNGSKSSTKRYLWQKGAS